MHLFQNASPLRLNSIDLVVAQVAQFNLTSETIIRDVRFKWRTWPTYTELSVVSFIPAFFYLSSRGTKRSKLSISSTAGDLQQLLFRTDSRLLHKRGSQWQSSAWISVFHYCYWFHR